MKKLLALILTVALILCCVPFGALNITASAATSGTTGDCTWTLNGTVLTISGNGKMWNYYSYSASPWGTSVTEVIIEDGVTSIGSSAFSNCTSLASITIPDSVTSIGDYAFWYCTSLTSVTIPNGVTSIGYDAFYNCTSLESIIIGNSVTSIGPWAFAYCTSLTSVTIPDSVKSIGYDAFAYCTSLTSVAISDSVKSIGDRAFYYCTSLTSVIIPNSVTSIGESAFRDCTLLESITIGNSVTSIGESAFRSCTSLVSVTIPDSVTSVDEAAFYNCTSITSITIPDSVTSIGSSAFAYCTSLASITIPDSVTSIGDDLFDSCSSLTSITIPDSVTSIGNDAFRNCTSLTSITIPDSVTSIGYYAFYYCSKLKEVWYGGTEDDSENIDIGFQNSDLFYATWYYEICSADEHIFSNCNDKTCANCEWTRADGHIYDNPCDTTCNVCTLTRETEHNYSLNDAHTCSGCKTSLTPNAPVIADKFGGTVVLEKHNGFEYSPDGVTWQISNTFKNLSAGTYTFYQRVKASNIALQSETSQGLSVTIKALQNKPDAPKVIVDLGNTVKLEPTNGAEYSLDGITWQSSHIFEGLSPNTTYTFYQRLAETQTHEASEKSEATTHTTDKITILNVPTPTVSSVSDDTVVLNKVDGCEYSLDGVNWQKNHIFDCLESNTTYTFYQRYRESDTHYLSIASDALIVKTLSDFVAGDINCDGEINVSDLAQLKKYIAGLLNASAVASCNPDVNGDATVNVSDLATLKKMIAGLA